MADKVLAYAKRENDHHAATRVKGLLTTDFARKKIVMELAPRFKYLLTPS